MLCKICGNEMADGAAFCDNCGAPVSEAAVSAQAEEIKPAEAAKKISPKPDASKKERRKKQTSGTIDSKAEITGHKVTENIYLCPDGKYRWIYEYRMLKNPTILITVLKGMTLSWGIVMGFIVLFLLIDGDFRYWNRSDGLSFFGAFLLLLLFLLVLSVVSYLILAAVWGWSYQVLLTMDEDGVELRMMKKDFQKAQAIGWLTAAAGLVSGNIGRVGTGILAATRDSSSSVFQRVRKVKAVRRRQVIYVNQLLGHNQVYAEGADYDFVLNYICERVPETARITK
ncbi:MAG: zinc ribbon domain-containing protein [Firmicutes bacterium]|nr:zinc ribbon domain-containing protein [Bacillota bacterium]